MDEGARSKDAGLSVTRVFAEVMLQSTFLAEVEAEAARDPAGGPRLLNLNANPENVNVVVTLSAQDSEGRRIRSAHPDIGMSGPRRGIWHRWHGPPLPENPEDADRIVLSEHLVDFHDMEDGINQMLGRDPTLHRPPRLSWGGLISALDEAGITVSESELIAVPLTVELLPDASAEIAS